MRRAVVGNVNAATALLASGFAVADAARLLADQFGCSQRQARRYVDRAAGGPVATPQVTTVFTVKLPAREHADARYEAGGERFLTTYNHEHRHSGIGMHTPASVHFDTMTEVQARRQATLDRAHTHHPERFTRRPQPPRLPEQAWINQPVLQPAQ